MSAFPRQTGLNKKEEYHGPQNKQDYYTESPKSLQPKCLQTTAVGLILCRDCTMASSCRSTKQSQVLHS